MAWLLRTPEGWNWMHAGACTVAERTPFHGCTGWGGAKRRSYTGGAP